jgi:hypothetical protein
MVEEIVFWLICAIAAAGVIEQQLQGMPAARLIGARLYSEAGKA